jgi:UPF0755 protein
MDHEPRSRRRVDDSGRRGGRSGGRGGGRGRGRKKKSGFAVLLSFVIIFGLIGGGGWYGYSFLKKQFGPPEDYSGKGEAASVVFVVESGWNGTKIANELKKAGVTKSVEAFTQAMAKDAEQRHVEAGAYVLHPKMPAALALDVLGDPKQQQAVTVTEGMRASAVYTKLSKQMNVPVEEFEKAAKDPAIGLPDYAKGNIEGFLFPAKYPAAPGLKPVDVLKKMVDTSKKKFIDFGLEDKAKQLNMTPYDVLKIASVVQAEAGPKKEDAGKVARVIDNRLADKMQLQMDSTVNYGMERSEIKVSVADTKKDHPWNTYTRQGLPETPINNPGKIAIEAALNPTAGDWIYFVTVNTDTGETKFTKSKSEHDKNVDQFNKFIEDKAKGSSS